MDNIRGHHDRIRHVIGERLVPVSMEMKLQLNRAVNNLQRIRLAYTSKQVTFAASNTDSSAGKSDSKQSAAQSIEFANDLQDNSPNVDDAHRFSKQPSDIRKSPREPSKLESLWLNLLRPPEDQRSMDTIKDEENDGGDDDTGSQSNYNEHQIKSTTMFKPHEETLLNGSAFEDTVNEFAQTCAHSKDKQERSHKKSKHWRRGKKPVPVLFGYPAHFEWIGGDPCLVNDIRVKGKCKRKFKDPKRLPLNDQLTPPDYVISKPFFNHMKKAKDTYFQSLEPLRKGVVEGSLAGNPKRWSYFVEELKVQQNIRQKESRERKSRDLRHPTMTFNTMGRRRATKQWEYSEDGKLDLGIHSSELERLREIAKQAEDDERHAEEDEDLNAAEKLFLRIGRLLVHYWTVIREFVTSTISSLREWLESDSEENGDAGDEKEQLLETKTSEPLVGHMRQRR